VQNFHPLASILLAVGVALKIAVASGSVHPVGSFMKQAARLLAFTVVSVSVCISHTSSFVHSIPTHSPSDKHIFLHSVKDTPFDFDNIVPLPINAVRQKPLPIFCMELIAFGTFKLSA